MLRRENLPEKVREYLEAKTNKAGDCLDWKGSTTNRGAPVRRLWPENITVNVRRWVIEQLGEIIPDKYAVTTTCGNPRCVAPEHFAVVSRSELGRIIDRRTGRNGWGEEKKAPPVKVAKPTKAFSHKKSELTIERVREIRARGGSISDIAKEFGLTQATVKSIRAYEIWKDYANPFNGLLR